MSNNFFHKELNRRTLLTASTSLLAAPLISSLPSLANAAAPFLGVSKPTFYRFELGAFEITTISDGEALIEKVYPIFGANASEKQVETLLTDNLMPARLFNPTFLPTVVNTGKELILFDTGNGENGFAPRPFAGNLAKQLAVAGFKPEQIDIVVITHGHSDHIGGIKEKDKEAFPNAQYVISDIEFNFWDNDDKLPKGLEPFAKPFKTNTAGLKEKFKFIKPGDEVVSGIEAVKAYGHTPGHLAFHIESKGKEMLLMADCAHHHVLSLARPDWHMVFDADKEQGAQTRKTIFDMAAKDKLPIIGFHMPFPGIGFIEKRDAMGYRWVPNSYPL